MSWSIFRSCHAFFLLITSNWHMQSYLNALEISQWLVVSDQWSMVIQLQSHSALVNAWIRGSMKNFIWERGRLQFVKGTNAECTGAVLAIMTRHNRPTGKQHKCHRRSIATHRQFVPIWSRAYRLLPTRHYIPGAQYEATHHHHFMSFQADRQTHLHIICQHTYSQHE